MIDEILEIDDVSEKKLSAEEVANLMNLGEQQISYENKIQQLEDALKKQKEEYNELISKTIPDAMASARRTSLPLGNGKQIVIKDILKASLPTKGMLEKAEKDDPDKYAELQHQISVAMNWIRKNGGDPIIKNVVNVEFSKGQDNIVGDLIGLCNEHGLPVARIQNVHPSTLSNFIKEKMKLGVEVPEELNVYNGKASVIK